MLNKFCDIQPCLTPFITSNHSDSVPAIQYNKKNLYSAYSHRVFRALKRRELISNVQKSRFLDSA